MTNSCNLKCIYCYANGGIYNKKIEFMSESIITKLFSFLKRNKIIINELQFLGGEPLIASNQIETVFNLLEKLEVYPLNISMVTNFTYLPEHIVDLLIKWKVYITVSIDGEKQINDLLRKSHDGSSTYELVKKILHHLGKEEVLYLVQKQPTQKYIKIAEFQNLE